MFATVVLPLPGRGNDVALDVVRRIEGAGREDLFFVSEASLLRASGRQPNNTKHATVVEWLMTDLNITVGRAHKTGHSFLKLFPNETHVCKMAEAMGNNAADPLDRWFVSLRAASFILVRAENESCTARAACFGVIFACLRGVLVERTDALVAVPALQQRAGQQHPLATPPPLRAPAPASAPARLGARQEPPATPIRQGPGPGAVRGPLVGVLADVDAAGALEELAAPGEVLPETDGAAVSAEGVPSVAFGPFPIRDDIMQRFNNLALPDEYAAEVPLTASLGAEVTVDVAFVYPGKVEIERRLGLAGHVMMKADGAGTRGPWDIVYMGAGRTLVVLGQFGRRTVGRLTLKYTEKGQPCTGTLKMAANVVRDVAARLSTLAPIVLPSAFESVRDRVERDPSLFPIGLRSDPSSGNAASFKPLHDEVCDIIPFSTLRLLVRTTKFNCAKCGRACRATVDFRRTQFRALECFSNCPSCGTTTVFFSDTLDHAQQQLRRFGAVATTMAFPATDQFKRFCRLVSIPNYSKLRIHEDRALIEAVIAPCVRGLGHEEFVKQMAFHRHIHAEMIRRAEALRTEDRHKTCLDYVTFLQDTARLGVAHVSVEDAGNAASAVRLLTFLRECGALSATFDFVQETKELTDLVFGPASIVVGGDIVEEGDPDDKGKEEADEEAEDDDELPEVADEECPAPLAQRALFGENAETKDPLRLGGDGQHARNARNFGAGHALACYVALVSGTTGAIIVQVSVARKDLAAARERSEEEARRKFPDDIADSETQRKEKKKKRREFVDGQRGFEYVFNGETFYTNYVLGESAALDLALKIARRYMGEEALQGGLAYDELSSCNTTLASVFPGVKRVADPWHATKNLRNEIEALEKDKTHVGHFAGLTEILFPQVREKFKDKTRSADEKAAWGRGWTFPSVDGRVLPPLQTEALGKLKETIAKALAATKGGFNTSLIESYWSTHSSFWAKGHRYPFATLEMRQIYQALHWNRVAEWPQMVMRAVLPLIETAKKY
jgi:hypothetical protein